MKHTETEKILGFRVASVGRDLCNDQIAEWIIDADHCKWLACLNPHSYVLSVREEEFGRALNDADWLIADGVGIVLASRVLGLSIRERVTGSDVFWGVQERLNDTVGRSVFFLGATEEVLGLIRDQVQRDFPRVRIAGTLAPPFRAVFSEDDTERMVAIVNAARPDVLWVGMTAPKQELLIYRNRHRLNVKFAAGVGAVFDFYSGRVKRSHPVFQRLGLEWLPRLLREPRRLWTRMFVSAPVFLSYVVRELLRRRTAR
jgi:N-acetylglucosaminyldiphosphoundecaprenol N-acetyl-beta-D-mannosaminyltransferase